MAEKKHRVYTEEFKLEALGLLKSSGKSATQIERDLGITAGMLTKWRDRYQVANPDTDEASLEPSDLEAAKREIKRLRRQLAYVEEEREILKKNDPHFLPEKRMRYPVIAEHAHEFGVEHMCQVLGVGRSGYYAWKHGTPGPRAQANQALLGQIRSEYDSSRQTYGSPRIHVVLRRKGVVCGRHRVARLMRQDGLCARRRHKAHPVTTQRQPGVVPAPNWLNQDFAAQSPNQKWVSDFTYIETGEGWLYLAVVLDLFSRKVIGWSMRQTMDTVLVETALRMALLQRQPKAGLLHHSDQGSQYTSAAYLACLNRTLAKISMSRTGNCYDNAVAESFFSTLKTECVRGPFLTHIQARTTLFEYMEVWYNRQRIHSTLGYHSPVDFEQQFSL